MCATAQMHVKSTEEAPNFLESRLGEVRRIVFSELGAVVATDTASADASRTTALLPFRICLDADGVVEVAL